MAKRKMPRLFGRSEQESKHHTTLADAILNAETRSKGRKEALSLK